MKRKELDLEQLLSQKSHKAARKAPSSPDCDRGEDHVRASVVQLLSKALDADAAAAVEAALHALEGGCNKAYKAAARKLSANLQRNTELCASVNDGVVGADALVRMDAAQLATQEQQKQVAKSQEKLLRRATMHDSSVVTSDYVCPECKSSACSYVELGRRDIGKSETWGAKQNEDKGRTVTCLTCNHKWEADMV